MNKDRRKRLSKAIGLLNDVTAKFNEAMEIVDECRAEERDTFDNMPEGLQQSERGQQAEQAADALDNVHSDMEAFDIDGLISLLGEAIGE